MLTIRFIRAKSHTTRHEYMGLPEKQMGINHETIWVRPKPTLVFEWWVKLKKSRGINPITGEQLLMAELLEDGEYNKTYTTVNYARRVDVWDPTTPLSVPEALTEKYAPPVPVAPPTAAPEPEGEPEVELPVIEPEPIVEGDDDGISDESSDGRDAGDHI